MLMGADNQWQVNFNLYLSSFEPFLAGTANLIDLSASSVLSPLIFFTSSIGTVSNFPACHPDERVPETPLADPRFVSEDGYSQSNRSPSSYYRLLANYASRMQ